MYSVRKEAAVQDVVRPTVDLLKLQYFAARNNTVSCFAGVAQEWQKE